MSWEQQQQQQQQPHQNQNKHEHEADQCELYKEDTIRHDDLSMKPFPDCIMDIIMLSEELRYNTKQQQQQRGNGEFIKLESTILTQHIIFHREQLERIHHQMHETEQKYSPSDKKSHHGSRSVEYDLYLQGKQKVQQVSQLVLNFVFSLQESITQEDSRENVQEITAKGGAAVQAQHQCQQLEIERTECQASIARIVELNLIHLSISTENNGTIISEIIGQYATYQRRVIRERCKVSIAKLAKERKQRMNSTINNDNVYAKATIFEHEPAMTTTHAQVITTVLGQASSLIHPLLVWYFSLPPPPESQQHHQSINGNAKNKVNPLNENIKKLCIKSISLLQEQTTFLTKTLSDWFWHDREVDDWMKNASSASVSNINNDKNDYHLSELDGLVEEMAFICQVLARYQVLLQDYHAALQQQQNFQNNNNTSSNCGEYESLVSEYTWKYSTLERFLVLEQWQSALRVASPVNIVIGTSIQVPSIVEDAQYLSTRALERSISTRSIQAVGTVAHSISVDVWATMSYRDEISDGYTASNITTVHTALLNETGCWSSPTNNKIGQPKKEQQKGSYDDFASVLLDALEDEEGIDGSKKGINLPSPRPRSRPPSAPNSAGFSLSMVGTLLGTTIGPRQKDSRDQPERIDTQLCTLNGIHSASAACSSLVKFIDGMDFMQTNNSNNSSNSNMIKLAREELNQYSQDYDEESKKYISNVIIEYCGDISNPADSSDYDNVQLPFHVLQNHFKAENYELRNSANSNDKNSLSFVEKDDRLQSLYINPLKHNAFISQWKHKCDTIVLYQLYEQFVSLVVRLILQECCNFNDINQILEPKKQCNENEKYTLKPDDREKQQQQQHCPQAWLDDKNSNNDNQFISSSESTEKKKNFTEWGSLLLSKQVRLIQNYTSEELSKTTNTGATSCPSSTFLVGGETDETSNNDDTIDIIFLRRINQIWEPLSQIITLLQMEKPLDWLIYQPTSMLSIEQVHSTMKLRTDFSKDAINFAIGIIQKKQNK